MKKTMIPLLARLAAIEAEYEASCGIPQDTGGDLPRNVVCLANDSRFVQSYFSQPLTTYAVGLPADDPAATLDAILPPVPVSRRFSYRSWSDNESLQSELVDDARAIGADFKQVELTGTEQNGSTKNKGLCVSVDVDEVADNPNWEQLYTQWLIGRLNRNELRRAAALIDGASTNTGVTWDATAGKDPDADARTAIRTGHTAAGIRPSVGLYGAGAWDKRFLSLRAQSHAGGFASSTLDTAQLARTLQLRSVVVAEDLYQSTASAKAAIMDGVVYFFHQTPSPIPRDPSNVKRFVTMVGGGKYRVYMHQPTAKRYVLSVEHYSDIVVTYNKGIRKLTVS